MAVKFEHPTEADLKRVKQLISRKVLPRKTETFDAINNLPREALLVLRAVYGIRPA